MKLKKQKLLVDAMQDAFLDEAKQIEEEIKDVPMFFYVPEGFEYLRYEVHPDAEVATMYYQYGEDNIITLQMFSNNGDYARGTSIDGDLTKSIKLVSEDLTVDLWTFENEINDDKAYCAQWMYKIFFCVILS